MARHSRGIAEFEMTITLGGGVKWSFKGAPGPAGVTFQFGENVHVHSETLMDLVPISAEMMAYFMTQLERGQGMMDMRPHGAMLETLFLEMATRARAMR